MGTYNVSAPTGNATTDKANIQAALTSANGDPGSTVILATGTYYINAQLLIGSNTIFTGVTGSKIKLANGMGWTTASSTHWMVAGVSSTVHDIAIHGFEIDGNEANQSGYGGADLYRIISFQGSTGAPVNNISVYNMVLRDAKGEGFRVTNGTNISCYGCTIYNTQHCCIMYSRCNTATMHDNNEGVCCSSGDRIDACKNVTIYNETLTPYAGTSTYAKNSYGLCYSDNSVQIDDISSTEVSQNIVVRDNNIKGGVNGIWLQGLHDGCNLNIYNNTIHDSGYESEGVVRNGGIGINACGNGITIQNNIISGSYFAGINIDSAVVGSTKIITIKNNNIINGVTGYAIKNRVSTSVSLTLYHNYLSGNPSNYYPSSLVDSNPATSSNPAFDDGSGGGDGDPGTPPSDDDNTNVGPYIPRGLEVRESLAEYFASGYNTGEGFGYINKHPIRACGYSPVTPKTISNTKSPGTNSRNLGDYGWGGSDLSLNVITFATDEQDAIKEAQELIAAFNSGTRQILEPGGPYEGWYLKGLLSKPQSSINKLSGDNDNPEDTFFFNLLFLTDDPYYRSVQERIREQTNISQSYYQWSTGNPATGNQLKNNTFGSWSSGVSDVAPDWWTLETTGQEQSDYTPDDIGFSYKIIGDGTTADLGSVTQPISIKANKQYVLKATGKLSNVTQGKLMIEVWAGGTIVQSLSWSVADNPPGDDNYMLVSGDGYTLLSGDGYTLYAGGSGSESTWMSNQVELFLNSSINDAIVRIHATETPNNGAELYIDNVYFGLASDIELVESGTDIMTYGTEDVTPDFMVSASASSNTGTTQDVPGTQVTWINHLLSSSDDGSTYARAETSYNTEVTISLPALSAGGKYRIDNISAKLAIADITYYCYVKVLITSASLGTDVQLAEWSSQYLYTTAYELKTLAVTGVLSANEAVTIKFQIKTTSYGVYARMKECTVKYTPMTPSTSYGDVEGTQVNVSVGSDVYSSVATAYVADETSLEWEYVLPATAGVKYRIDGLSFYLATATSGQTASMKVTIQSATTWATETLLIDRNSVSVQPIYTLQSAVSSNVKSAANEAVTLRFYLKTSSASHRAYAKYMSFKYTPLTVQTPVDPESTTNNVTIWNVADPSTTLQLCSAMLPGCTIWKNGDRTGSFEYYDAFGTNNYASVMAGHTGTLVYDAVARTLTVPASGDIWFVFDTGSPITGIPFVQAQVVSGAPQFSISEDGITWYDIDGNDSTALVDTPVYRELDNLANCRLKGNTLLYVKVSAGATASVLGLLRVYSDTVNLYTVFPKIFANRLPNTFSILLTGNPVNITIRSRDARMVI